MPLHTVPWSICLIENPPETCGGLSSSFLATRKVDTTVGELVAVLGHAAMSSGPSMSPAKDIPAQPLLLGIGAEIWPMKSVVGFSGSAIPKPT